MGVIKPCQLYWRGYSNAKFECSVFGLEETKRRFDYGYTGNGPSNYERGFSAYLRKAWAARTK